MGTRVTTPPEPQWPPLPFEAWQDTCATLHLWTQIIGKVRLARSPWINHSWGVTLYLTAQGLTTSPIPHGARVFEIDLDFINHRLSILASDGASTKLALRPQSVASFFRELWESLRAMGLGVDIRPRPNEVEPAIPFVEDELHRQYDRDAANRFFRVLVQADRVFKEFRARFIGKCSPVHFFWGSFDLAATRFSGRRAPPHPGGIPNLPDRITREAYSHEVSSCGFWPGGPGHNYPLFYSYAYPEPPGFAQVRIRPEGAFYSPELREFVLPYEVMREAVSPDAVLLEFLQASYEAAADLGRWDRAELERTPRVRR